MSSDTAIQVTHLSKCYQIYDKPSDRLKQTLMRGRKNYYREFWALNDISFSIQKGETVGIIGRNGSGKSTLLQMVCGTLNPTNGHIQTHGRIAALLELGSGFNPEFSGRENIYLNGTILGLTHQEIETRYADIVAFADIGQFIEQPVKTYSSGMVVRLAFAVIAHVDADILIIDEALSVGDVVFTQKCMRFLRTFMETGTVLFVSHDTSSVSNLCNKAIWIHQGKLRMSGDVSNVINAYNEYCQQEIYGNEINLIPINSNKTKNLTEFIKIDPEIKINFYDSIENSDGWKSGYAEICSVNISNRDGSPITTIVGGESILLTIEAKIFKSLSSPIIGFFVKDRLGQSLFGEHTFTYTQPTKPAIPGENLIATFAFNMPMLPNGDYSMTTSIADGDPHVNVQHHWLHDALIINVNSPKLRYGLMGIQFDSVNLESFKP